MYVEPFVVSQPAFHLWVFVRCIVITHNVNVFVLRRGLINLAQKFQPFLMTMPLGAGTQYLSGKGVQCSKQRRGAIALVVMRHCCRLALFYRQARLRSMQCLYLTLFITTEYNGILWR